MKPFLNSTIGLSSPYMFKISRSVFTLLLIPVSFTNREFLIVNDTGISKRVKTDRDILNMYGEDRPIVEFRNGFIIY